MPNIQNICEQLILSQRPAAGNVLTVDATGNDAEFAAPAAAGIPGIAAQNAGVAVAGGPFQTVNALTGVMAAGAPGVLNYTPPASSSPTAPVAGFALWAKADGKLTKDGANRVTAFGEDATGTPQFVYDGTIGHAPVWTSNTTFNQNGIPFLRFTAGALQYLQVPLALTNAPSFAVFLVSRDQAGATGSRFLMFKNGGGPDFTGVGNLMLYRDPTGVWGFRAGGTIAAITPVPGIGFVTLESYVQNTEMLNYRNRTLNNGAAAIANNLAVDSAYLCARASAGAYGTADTFTTVDIFEVLLYPSALTEVQITATIQYLKAKYGLTF